MTGLPFVQQPAKPKTKRCGTAQSGILEFPVLGGLTVGESKTIAQLVGNTNTVFIASAKVAHRIAEKENITISEAFSLVEQTLGGQTLEPKADEAVKRNSDDIDELRELCSEHGHKAERALVIALVRSRLNMPDWDAVDDMHQALFDAIASFGVEEQNAEEIEAAEPPTEADLKKRQRVSRNGKRSTTTVSAGS